MAPTRTPDDGILLLINSISEQVKQISIQQEQLRTYLLTQIDELRKTVIAKEEYRDNLDAVRRELASFSSRIDKLETTVTEKIERVGNEAKQYQDNNFKAVIRVQALVLGFMASTIVGIIVKVFILH